ncbi:type IV pilus assembly protein FimV [Denitromonas iodatirespirans]|uniref:FimV N-terminal domain-containing protein n=1 Tax=Denitromonas iodatirespirans TaxID=2795389 RepID=A0A944HCE9_DENI1|nr:hypothetical protein [Denitromonas iodatirespirans]MBT0962647.1 hypothetical protein [Denitromonas iodatirespirans]
MNSPLRPTLLLLWTLAVLPATTHAIGFGEIISQSAIGEPFRAEVRLHGLRPNESANCLRTVPGPDSSDGIPAVLNTQIAIDMRAGNPVAVVTRRQAVHDPIVRLTLEETCSARLKRTYTLLLPSPIAAPVPPVAARATPAPSPTATDAKPAPVTTAALGGAWTLTADASINQLARQLFPASREDRIGFIRATRALNRADRSIRSSRQTLAAGSTLQLPTREAIAAAHPAPVEAAAPAAAPTRARPPAPAPDTAPPADTPPPAAAADAPPNGDRLSLSGDTAGLDGFKLSQQLGDPGLIDRTTEAERELLRREQQLIMKLDEQITARLELTDRIARIEEIQRALAAQLGSSATSVADATTAPAAAPAPAPAPTEAPSAPATSAWQTLLDWLPLALAGLLATLLAAWLVRRRRSAPVADNAPDETPTTPPRAEARAMPVPQAGESFDFSPVEWDGSIPAELQHSVAPIAIEEADLSAEHESAVELADIMMSFGRIQGAAETLAEFIRSNPKQAVTPWLKLLEVYRAADMRDDFEVITRQLNKTFNVKIVGWDEFDTVRQTTDSVEQMAHIVKMLTDTWMTVDCQAYIQRLLRDNRDGARQGFPIAVVDDLLMLMAVLEDRLGPYQHDDAELDETPIDLSTPLDDTPPEEAESPADTDAPASKNTPLPDLDFHLDSGDTPVLGDNDTNLSETHPLGELGRKDQE